MPPLQVTDHADAQTRLASPGVTSFLGSDLSLLPLAARWAKRSAAGARRRNVTGMPSSD